MRLRTYCLLGLVVLAAAGSPSSAVELDPPPPAWIAVAPDGTARPAGALAPDASEQMRRAAGVSKAQADAIAGVVEAANAIVGQPYSSAAAVSAALDGAGLVSGPQSLEELRRLGEQGPGRWFTVDVCVSSVRLVIADSRFGVDGATASWLAPGAPNDHCTQRHPAAM
jgi:hypothetical protein